MTQKDHWHEAAAMAARMHQGHWRKDRKKTPYFSHPARVALTVAVKFGYTDDDLLTAAFLHDVLEDTLVDYDDLLRKFNKEIADIVAALSKDSRMVEHEREKVYDEQLAGAGWKAKLIKLADVYDNLSDAEDDEIRTKMFDKAERALALAQGHPELEKASALVRALLEKTKTDQRA
jgi:(p)ppGpp synthase/HD superfamily hydrolase